MTCMPHVWRMCCHFSTFTRRRTHLSRGTSFTQPSIFAIFSSSHGVFYFVNQPTTHFVQEVAVSCNLCFLKWTCSVFFSDGSAEPLLEFSQHASRLSGNSNILWAKIHQQAQMHGILGICAGLRLFHCGWALYCKGFLCLTSTGNTWTRSYTKITHPKFQSSS